MQQELAEETGNIILLKDLSNIVNKRTNTKANDLDAVVDILMNKYGEFTITCNELKLLCGNF